MAMRELLWIRRLVQDVAMGFDIAYNPTSVVHSTVWEDNQGCISVARRPDLTARTRHIVTKYHHFKDNIKIDANGDGIQVAFCPSVDMQADIMTKGVKQELFIPLRDKLMGWHYLQNDVGLDGELKNQVGDTGARSEMMSDDPGDAGKMSDGSDPGWRMVRPRTKHGDKSQLSSSGVTVGVKSSHTGNNNVRGRSCLGGEKVGFR